MSFELRPHVSLPPDADITVHAPTWPEIQRMIDTLFPRRLPVTSKDWRRDPSALPPVLSTEQPFPIRYAADVWEQLHPLDELLRREQRVHYLPNPLSNARKR